MIPPTEIDKYLDDAFLDELFDRTGIPNDERIWFKRALRNAIRFYLEHSDQKPTRAVVDELNEVAVKAEKALRLGFNNAWRPGKFKETLQEISELLAHLSDEAVDHLSVRSIRVLRADEPLPAGADPYVDIVDPFILKDRCDQWDALHNIYGAMSKDEHHKQPRGRLPKKLEPILFRQLQMAYNHATGKKDTATSPKFMELCDGIAWRCDLEGEFCPDTWARTLRGRAGTKKQK